MTGDRTEDVSVTVAADPRGGSKLLGLEVIRFLSACAVLIWHYQHFYYVGDKPGPDYIVQNQPLYSLLAPFYNSGHFGVNVFWCISGFIFFWKYREAIAHRRIGAWKFFVLRFSRLYPLHVATLVLVAALQTIYTHRNGTYYVYAFNDAYHFVLQLFFASNWGIQQGFSFNGPIWSISTEVLVYILFFATLRYLGISLWVAAIAIGIAGAAKVMKLESPIVDCLGFFYVGGVTCVLRDHVSRTRLDRPARTLCWAMVFVMPALALRLGIFAYLPFAYLFWLTYSPLLLYVAAGDFTLGGRARGLVEAAGNMTYSIFLIHFPLQLAIAAVCTTVGRAIPAGSTVFLVGYVLVTLILAYLLFERLEKPAQRGIRTWLLHTAVRTPHSAGACRRDGDRT